MIVAVLREINTDLTPEMMTRHFNSASIPQLWMLTISLFFVIAIATSLMGEGLTGDDRSGTTGSDFGETSIASEVDRSPVDLAITSDDRWIVTANQLSNSVSLIRLSDRSVVDELPCGKRPVDIETLADGRVLVTAQWSGELHVFRIEDDRLHAEAVIGIGGEPHGIAITPDGERAFVGLVATAQVAEIDLVGLRVTRRLDVGNWPNYVALSPDGSRLAVGNGGDSNVMVLDTTTGQQLYEEPLANGTNLGQMRSSADGKYVYFTWMVYRTNPINVGNIRRGWVLASRIGRVRLDGPAYREAMSLDVPGQAVSDPHDLEISADQQTLVASSAGTHELLVYRLLDLPFEAHGGPGDLIDRRLQNDRDRFHRIEVGGRPMGIRIAPNSRTVYVANYLHNAIQVIDLEQRKVIEEIDLGGSKEKSIARVGAEIFYDGRRSLDQWYSCHSCHQDGGINARPMDTMNDGTEMTLKTVLPLYHLTETFPWTWHGWQTNLNEAMEKSITSTMMGKSPSEEDKRALIAFLATLQSPPNPFRQPDGSLSEAAQRGKAVFYSRKAACIDCHNGPYYSDGKIHDVGLGSESDVYQGYNTPPLVGVYRKVRLLHSGRARDLDRVVNDLHRPEHVNGEGGLTEQESADLIEFLKSL